MAAALRQNCWSKLDGFAIADDSRADSQQLTASSTLHTCVQFQSSDVEFQSNDNETAVKSASTFEKPAERAKRSGSTPDPGSLEKVRRTRGAHPAKRSETPTMKSNGHDAGAAKVNGHGLASPSRTAQEREAPLEKGRAASDDARDFPTAAAASSAAAGKERDACAEVAQAPEGEKNSRPKKRKKKAGTGTSRVPSEKNKAKGEPKDEPKDNPNGKPTRKGEEDTVDIPPGSKPLPEDGAEFVDAMHEHVDIYQACGRLVKSGDQKIGQRMLERLLEMKYGKGTSPTADESPEIVIDIDSAVTRRAAEGAKK